MKERKKLYKALVYRGPLQPRAVNHLVTNQIQKSCLLMYLKCSNKTKGNTLKWAGDNNQNYISKTNYPTYINALLISKGAATNS